MRSYILALAGLALVASGATLHAASPARPLDELRTTKEHVDLQASGTKGGPQHLLLMKSRRLSDVIDRLERGGSVDPREIDRLLEEAGQPTR